MLINLDALVPLFNRCADSAVVSRTISAGSQGTLTQGSSSSCTGSQRSASWTSAMTGCSASSDALAVATDKFELIHSGAGVGVEGGDPFVIVEAVVADRIALLPIGEADLIDQPPRVQSHLPQPTSASVRAASH